jgi:hydrogenase nickel incorporation protein HypB
MLQVRRNILKGNDMVARRLRDFRHAGVVVISLLSSPGSGKTTLLERVLSDFGQEYRVAALVGDLATENDATRLAQAGCQSSRSTPVLCAISTPV